MVAFSGMAAMPLPLPNWATAKAFPKFTISLGYLYIRLGVKKSRRRKKHADLASYTPGGKKNMPIWLVTYPSA